MKETRTVVLDNLENSKKRHAYLRWLRGVASGRIKLKTEEYSASKSSREIKHHDTLLLH